MLKSNRVNIWYLSLTWTRSLIRSGIALRCDLDSPSLNRHPTSSRNISLSRNPSRSRSPSDTRSP